MQFDNATKPDRKSGVAKWRDLQFSQPASALNRNTTVTFVIPTGAYPDFLLRSTTSGRVCGFP